MDSQRCGRCKRVLPLESFSPSYRGKPGTWCRECFTAYMRAWREAGEPEPAARHEPRTCESCGREYVPKQLKSAPRFCSRKCKEDARWAAQRAAREVAKPADRQCMHCGDPMPQRMRADAKFCSALCNEAAHALQRKLRSRTGEAAKPGYLRAFICERDRWQCGICHKKVNRKLRHPHPLCASLDHILPVSEGGTNDIWNLRLTHLVCNLTRRAGQGEMLPLF